MNYPCLTPSATVSSPVLHRLLTDASETDDNKLETTIWEELLVNQIIYLDGEFGKRSENALKDRRSS